MWTDFMERYLPKGLLADVVEAAALYPLHMTLLVVSLIVLLVVRP